MIGLLFSIKALNVNSLPLLLAAEEGAEAVRLAIMFLMAVELAQSESPLLTVLLFAEPATMFLRQLSGVVTVLAHDDDERDGEGDVADTLSDVRKTRCDDARTGESATFHGKTDSVGLGVSS